ncbi:YraN family protein [Niveibacterium sp. SC-1]|uniref:YraN family protein n=1 Tax=Niveibacterium sp. SC-1 TaxID=3135646 RepID=UPI00311DBA43
MQLIKRIHDSVNKVLGSPHSEGRSETEQLPAHLRDGQLAERLAETYLTRQGLKVVARNVRSRWGEIDLIATDGEILVFAEVRMRSDPRFGGAAESISREKQRKLVRSAEWFLAHGGKAWSGRPCRFDAVLLDRLHLSHIEWIKGAFDAD